MTSPTNPPRPSISERLSRTFSSGGSRRAHDPEARFTRNVTIAFVVLIVAVALVVIIGLGYGFWEANFKPLASVSGAQIGRGEWEDRQRLEAFRTDRADTTTRAALLAGDIDEDLANSRLQATANARSASPSAAMETLVDLHFQKQLAEEQGVTLSEDELTAALAADGTLPEVRRIAALAIQPAGAASGLSTPEDIAEARVRAQEALAALQSGTPIADLVEEYSPATAANDGDLGYRTLENLQGIDAAWAEALFELEEGGITEVTDSSFGDLLVGVVTSIVPETPDEGFVAAVNDQVGEGIHRRNVELEALAAKLDEKISADAVAGDFEQVRLAEILVAGDTLVAPEDDQPTVRASHILFRPEPAAPEASPAPGSSPAPGNSPDPVSSPAPGSSPDPAASSAPETSPAPEASPAASPDPDASPTPIPADDPSWGVAQAEADAAAADLRAVADGEARMEAFAARAEAESDDSSGANGGDLGFFTRAAMVPEFSAAIFDAVDPQQGDIIGPVRSEFGWHVIMFDEARGTLAERLAAVQQALAADGADFATVATELSDGAEATDGGDIGWRVLDDLGETAALALSATEIGEITEPVDGEAGYSIYQKLEEATRPLDPADATSRAQTAFADWYQELRFAAEDSGDISIDGSVFDEAEGAAHGG
jgi:parvulin-like peptidyl-prolyl isomerase